MFALDEELARWEAVLPEISGAARLPLLVALAWHLRQRAPARARALSGDIVPLLGALPPADALVVRGRLLLIAAEAEWLNGRLDTAQYQAEQALALFEQAVADTVSAAVPGAASVSASASASASDPPAAMAASACARADACWVLAWVSNDRGDSAAGDRWLARAGAAARAGGDPVRVDVIDAAAGICAAFGDWQAAQRQWDGRFDADPGGLPPIAAGWVSDYLGTCAFQRSEYGRAIGHLMPSFEMALVTGQVRRAIIIATNIGNGFTSLNAHEAALEWMQRGLDLARPAGWPLSIGMCLMQTAETLRQLGQREAAQTLLREALACLLYTSPSPRDGLLSRMPSSA